MPRDKTSEAKRVKTIKELHGDQVFKEYGAKGGRTKTDKLKGFAWLKVHKPEEFKAIYERRKRNVKS